MAGEKIGVEFQIQEDLVKMLDLLHLLTFTLSESE